MPDIFLSYSRDDQTTARRFAEGFERERFSVWWDATLHSGEAYDQVTEKALREAKAVVVLWSKTSVDSRWVRAEATTADRNKTLVPVMIEACNRPIMFELTHTADLSHWKGDTGDEAWRTYVADVRRFVQRDEQAQFAPQATSRPNQNPRIDGRSIAILAAVVIIAGGILWAISRKGSEPGLKQNSESAQMVASQSSAPVARAPQGVSLAVLPFVNMSADPQQEYFSDGLSEELLNQLAQIKELRVAGRTSSFSFKGKNEDLRVIGEKLGVNHLLEGSVRKDGKQLRITAQLINAADGTHLWSQTYDRELSGIFAVQEEIAKDVTQALSIALDVGEMTRAQGGTTNIDAYDKYLQARKLFEQSGADAFKRSAQLYRDSLALDPNFARAWYGLYRTLSISLVWIPENAATERKEMAAASEHIVALAPDAWWTHAMRANELAHQRKWSEAEVAASAVMTAAAASQTNETAYGQFLWNVGRANEAVSYYERVQQADPLSLGASVSLQMILDGAGYPEKAQTEYERSKKLSGDRAIAEARALQRLWLRKNASATVIAAQFRRFLEYENPRMALNHSLADRPDDKEAARALIHKAFGDLANQDSTRMYMVLIYADHYGDKDLALAALRRYYELGGNSFYALWWPYESGLRSDPRFKDILRDLKLADYFRTSGNWGDFCKPIGKDDFECH